MLRFFFFTFLLGFPGAPVEYITLMLSLNSKNVNIACLLWAQPTHKAAGLVAAVHFDVLELY